MRRRPLSSEEELYVKAVRDAKVGTVQDWLTAECPECSRSLGEFEFVNEDHVMLGPNVVIACEFYWVIDPNAVGMVRENWCDWRLETQDWEDDS